MPIEGAWPHQQFMFDQIKDHKSQRLLTAAPTGAGKSRVMTELIKYWVSCGKRVMLLTHRQMLRDQLAGVMQQHNVPCSMLAAGFEYDPFAQCYVAMDKTIESWVFRQEKIELPDVDIVLPDEAHLQSANVHQEIFDRTVENGGRIVGFTATPVGLGAVYDTLLVGAKNSDCRKCGAHVLAWHLAGKAGDIAKIKPVASGVYQDGETVRRIMTPVVNGDVMEHWKNNNPHSLPTVLFAPSVPSSLWVAERFTKLGVNTAHIDAKDIWMEGETMPSTPENRLAVMDASKSGRVKIVTNRFVMKEGLDWPWLSVISFCTCFGSLKDYLQAGGRVLRASPSTGKTEAIVLDHGNHYPRHGSLNLDRDWELHKEERDYEPDWKPNDIGERKEPEPICCSECGMERRAIVNGVVQKSCPRCGHESARSVRPIRQTNGKLVLMKGDFFSSRKPKPQPQDAELWRQYYFRCKRSKKPMTFNQARGLFFRENKRWPATDLPLMPMHESNWCSKINDVPTHELHGTHLRDSN